LTTVPQTALEGTYPYYGLKTVAPSQFHPSLMTRLGDRALVWGGEAVMSVGFHPATWPTRSGDRILGAWVLFNGDVT